MMGTIPLKRFRIAEGMVELTASANDYHSQTEFVNVQRDQDYPHVFNLDRHTGKLIVITEPPDADVYLDGEGKGKTPSILNEIPIGSHTIKVRHPKFLPQSETFTLALNENRKFHFKLMTYEGSIQEDIDKAKFKQRISLGSSAAFALFGFIMQGVADKNYDSYLNAGTSGDASDYFDKTTLNDKMSGGSFDLAGVLLIPTIKFTMDIRNLKKKMSGR